MDRPRRDLTLVALQASPGVAVAVLGVTLTYFGYLWGLASPNPAELSGPVIFFAAVLYVLFSLPLRGALQSFYQAVRTKLGAGIFVGYLVVHLVLYGFLLEEVLALTGWSAALAVPSSGLFVYTDVFYPPSLTSAVFNLSYNPSIIFNLLPVFSAALSAYAIALALVIAILVVANVSETKKVSRICSAARKARSYVLVPVLGIILGASCCLSVAGLVSLYTLPLAVAAEVSSNATVYYLTYFFLPAFAIVILYLNLRSTSKLGAGLLELSVMSADGKGSA